VGSGIAGLTAAYYLSRKYEVHVFEKDTRIGGHTHTVTVDSSRGPLPVDTGFIVHNRKTYPNFCRLMNELGVDTEPSDMSFGVYSPETGFEYSSRGARGFFADPLNALRTRHWHLLREILRFNREAPQLLERRDSDLSLGYFLGEGRYSKEFMDRYLYPMASAVWSMSPDLVMKFPAVTLVRFFANHGMLGINTHPQWRVLKGGSQSYFPALTAPYRERLHTGATIESIQRSKDGVSVVVRGQEPLSVDQVVFACHRDQVLPMLADASDAERDVLQHFRNSSNETVLHSDSSLLPRRPAARASWNYRLGASGQVSLTYHMNRLQSLNVAEDYCVTLNATDQIDPAKVIRKMVYEHPIYDRAAILAQARWREISGQRRTHFCGAYWSYGFHEDGVNSALRVARMLGVEV
jgi:predicted NAD/FAD-binding protein